MKKVCLSIIALMTFVILFYPFNVSYCEEDQIINPELKGQLVQLKQNQLRSLDDYVKEYGSKIYGTVAYILNGVRLFSIPICFLGIVYGAVKQFVTGVRRLDMLERGMFTVMSSVTVLVICQVLPLIFAIVVKFQKN